MTSSTPRPHWADRPAIPLVPPPPHSAQRKAPRPTSCSTYTRCVFCFHKSQFIKHIGYWVCLFHPSFVDFPHPLFQERNRPCSRCSQCSSTISSSPNFDKNRQRLSSLQYSPASSHGDESTNRRQFSLRGKRSRSESCDG